MARKAESDGGGDGAAAPPVAMSQEALPGPSSEPRRPVHVVRFGPVRACVWLNETEQGPRYNVTVNRLYRGADDQWHTSEGFGYTHLLPLAKALEQAHTWIADRFAGEVPF